MPGMMRDQMKSRHSTLPSVSSSQIPILVQDRWLRLKVKEVLLKDLSILFLQQMACFLILSAFKKFQGLEMCE